ncbi:chaplin [Streptomyces aureocirculatus]|uniref:chaplin n=1 Tax=Streptomyces aureocirculatus TaxID=67275 RepID=UPI0004C9797B|nr:chaplin family protein [Streptomyces aureocirculatus]
MRQVTRKGLITVAAATGVLAVTGGYAQADSNARGGSSNSPGVLSGNSVQVPVNAPGNVCGNTVNVAGALNPAMGNRCANESRDDHGGGYGDDHGGGYGDDHGGKPSGGATADGYAGGSPGVGSGNNIQLPVDAPVNVCGNSASGVGLGNPASGNECTNESGYGSTPPGEKPPTKPEEPGNPGNPEEPGNPGNPEHPGKPERPGNPGTPEHPGSPQEPGSPGKPGQKQPDRAGGPNTPVAHMVMPPEGKDELAQTGGTLPLGVALPVGAGMLLAGTVLYRRARA